MFDQQEVLRELRHRMAAVGVPGVGRPVKAAVNEAAVNEAAVNVDAAVNDAVIEDVVTDGALFGAPAGAVLGDTPAGVAVVGGARTSVPFDASSAVDEGGAVPGEGFGAVLPVADALAAVLPRGGLARGSVVSVLGQGATSLLFTLLAGPPESWSALVGMPGLGLLAAAEFGIDLDRLVVIPEPGPDVLQVLSILVDGVDIIAVTLPPQARPTPSRQRVLTGRLRQRGSVLLVMGPWPGADLVLTARPVGWSGLGSGHGRLRDREITVQVGGRGAAAGRGRQAALLLSADRTTVTVRAAEPVRQADTREPYEQVADVG